MALELNRPATAILHLVLSFLLFVTAVLAQSHRQSEKSRARYQGCVKGVWLFDELYVHKSVYEAVWIMQSNQFLSFHFFPSAGWQRMANSGDYYAVLGVQGLTCLLRSVSEINQSGAAGRQGCQWGWDQESLPEGLDWLDHFHPSPVKPGMASMCFYAFLVAAKSFGKEALKWHPDKNPDNKALGWSGWGKAAKCEIRARSDALWMMRVLVAVHAIATWS